MTDTPRVHYYDVQGISDWPETQGEPFPIFEGKPFPSKEAAIQAARDQYSPELEVEVHIAQQGPRLVLIEAPFCASTSARDALYAQRCLRHSLLRGEIPFSPASHYANAMEHRDPFEAGVSLHTNRAWLRNTLPIAREVLIYADYGLCPRVQSTIDLAREIGIPCSTRHIGKNPELPDLASSPLESETRFQRTELRVLHASYPFEQFLQRIAETMAMQSLEIDRLNTALNTALAAIPEDD